MFKSLRVVDVPGRPTFGECADEWVFDFVRAIFGAYDREQATQLITEFFLLISKKNTKSTIAAGIMVTAVIRNWREESEALILAPTLEVANNDYGPASSMVRADEELMDLLQVKDHLREITHRITRASLKVVAANAETVGGKKAAFVLVDELWEFGKRATSASMLMEATGGQVSRPEGFTILLSTQSDEPPAGVFKEKLELYRDIRDGKIVDNEKLGVLYEFPDHMVESQAYLDPAHFYVTNPNLDRSVRHSWLVKKLAEKQRGDVSGRNKWLAKHLNIEIGNNLRANRWPGAEYWAKGDDPELVTIEDLKERCEVIAVGIDGGGLDDLFGLVALGREKVTRRWLAWARGWCHEGVLERRKSIASVLEEFKKAGELVIVDDELKDISEIVAIISDIEQSGLLTAVAVDPAGLGELVEALDAVGISEAAGNLIGVPQGYALMNAIKTAERKLANGTLRHSVSGLFKWCISNIKIEPLATAIRATKANAGDAKIDIGMALFNAVTIMVKNPEAVGAFPADYEVKVW